MTEAREQHSPNSGQGVYLPLTPVQKDYIATELRRPGSTNCTMRVPAAALPPASPEIFERAIRRLVERHDSLRLRLVGLSRGLAVSQSPDTEIIYSSDSDEIWYHMTRPIPTRRADVSNLRVILDDTTPDNFCVRLVIPHAFTDGYSCVLLRRDLEALLRDDSLRVENGAFAAHSIRICKAYEDPSDDVLLYWTDEFREARPLQLRHDPDESPAAYATFRLGRRAEIQALSRSLRVTRFAFLLALFGTCVVRATSSEQVLIRTVVIGRRTPDEMNVTGPFIEFPLVAIGNRGMSEYARVQRAVGRALTATQPRSPLANASSTAARDAILAPPLDSFYFNSDPQHLESAYGTVGGGTPSPMPTLRPWMTMAPGAAQSNSMTQGPTPVDSASLTGLTFAIRGEEVDSTDDDFTYLGLWSAPGRLTLLNSLLDELSSTTDQLARSFG